MRIHWKKAEIRKALLDCWPFRWKGLTVAWACAAIGWGVVMIVPNTYEASAQIFVATDLTEYWNANSASETVTGKLKISTIWEEILGADQAARIRQSLQSKGVGGWTRNEANSVDRLLDRIEITGVAGWADLYSVSFRDSDKNRAKAVVEIVLDSFGKNIAMIKLEAKDATDWAAEWGESDDPLFKIVNVPSLSDTSVAPNRGLWTTVIFLASIGIGGGLIYLLGTRSPVFGTNGRDGSYGGVQIVSSVTHVWVDRARSKRQREIAIYGIAVTTLGLGFLISLLIQHAIAIS